jgi:hypothetical protein
MVCFDDAVRIKLEGRMTLREWIGALGNSVCGLMVWQRLFGDIRYTCSLGDDDDEDTDFAWSKQSH